MKSFLKYFFIKNDTDTTDTKDIQNTIFIKNFKGDINKEENILSEHSTDSSIFKIKPSLVLYPKDNDDIISVINHINTQNTLNPNHKISLSVRAGGTCMSGGSLNTGYILNMTKYMNSIFIDKDNMTAEVQMGAMLRDIQKEADKYDLMFAPYPSSRDICAIGGVLGNNASGEKSVRFGSTIDNVLSAEVILSNANIIQTQITNFDNLTTLDKRLIDIIKDDINLFKQKAGKVKKIASGYRLDKIMLENNNINTTPLFIGAQGTLGIISKATIKLVPKPKYTKLVVTPIKDIRDISLILKLAKQYNAESIETFDINTYQKARQFLPDYTKYTDFIFENDVTALILIQFSENTQEYTYIETNKFYTELQKISSQSKIIDDVQVSEAFWHIRRNSFSLVRDHHKDNQRAVPCIEDIVLPIENFELFIPQLVQILKEENLEYAYHGHIGDGSLRIIPLFDFKDTNLPDNIIRLTQKIMRLIKSFGGNISADHSDGIIRSPFIPEFYGEKLYQTFKNIKNLYDPKDIMNPNKKVNANISDIKKYINTD